STSTTWPTSWRGTSRHERPRAAESDHHGGAADAHHQHAAVLPDHLVVDVDADHRVGAELLRAFRQFLESDLAGLGQFLFIGTGTSADDVANTGEQVAEHVGTENGLTDHDALVFADGTAFEGGSGGEDHAALLGW